MEANSFSPPKMTTIQKVHARQVLDSRGNPTVEVEVFLPDGVCGRAIVPSGASTGIHEALELRDGDKEKYGGKSVEKAVANVNTELTQAVMGMDAADQRTLDAAMIALDGTPNKSRLGANAILGISMAAARAAAEARKIPLFRHFAEVAGVKNPTLLPTPMMNVINGGAHADSGLEIQEFMIVPTGAKSFSEALQTGAEIFHTLKKILTKRGEVTAVGDEGGFAPHFSCNTEALDILLEAVSEAGYAGKVEFAMDVAASEFYKEGKYEIEGGKNAKEMIDFFKEMTEKYPVVSIEDAFDEDDWTGFSDLVATLGDTIQLVGDDLLVTNPERIARAIDEKASNAVLIKMNQIGSVSETIDAVQMAQKAGWNTIISHRSGESEDTTIADLAVGLRAGQIKTGSLCRSERIAKYNRLLRIEEMLGSEAEYFGKIQK